MEISANRININFKKDISYAIYEEENIFSIEKNFFNLNKNVPFRRFVVLDYEVNQIYGDHIKEYFSYFNSNIKYSIIDSGESNKSVNNFVNVFKELDEFDVDRKNEPIISIGGGVATDVGSFVASCYRRGVPHINIPTTLMGYVDASIGIKTGVDFNGHKNRMGSFDAPEAVYLDRMFLNTLSERHLINGMGEILKIALIKDRELFEKLESEGIEAIRSKFQSDSSKFILNRSITDMLEELEPNLYEDNLERCVDFGHTFSPLLEMLDINNLLHGEAVAIDCIFSCCLSYDRGFLKEAEIERIFKLMKQLNLHTSHTQLDSSLLWDSVCERTKHRGGFQRIPLPNSIGHCEFVNNITKDELEKACDLIKYYNFEKRIKDYTSVESL